jgi:hypothetical protein
MPQLQPRYVFMTKLIGRRNRLEKYVNVELSSLKCLAIITFVGPHEITVTTLLGSEYSIP